MIDDKIPGFKDSQVRELPILSILLKLVKKMKLEHILQLPQIPIKQRTGHTLKINPKIQPILMH